MNEHIPRHRLEELAGASVPAELSAHLEGCPRCAARLAGIEEARAQYLAQAPAQELARRAMARFPVSASLGERLGRWFSPRSAGLGLGLAAAAALAFIWLRPGAEDSPPSAIRLKGGPSLRVFVKRGQATVELTDGAEVASGDQLAFAYTLPEPRHLVLLGGDRSETMTVYFSSSETASGPLAAGRAQLPVGVELDAHPGEERLVAVFSPSPLDEAAVRRAWTGARDAGVEVVEYRLRKAQGSARRRPSPSGPATSSEGQPSEAEPDSRSAPPERP
jgi:hypothetical protein